MVPIRQYFDYLVRKQYKYGYSVFLNINICRNNLEDVRQLTQLARDNGIATDYHICETPMMDQENFRHMENNPVFIRDEDHPAICELLDWLIDKQNAKDVQNRIKKSRGSGAVVSVQMGDNGFNRAVAGTNGVHIIRGIGAFAQVGAPSRGGQDRRGEHHSH